MAARIVTSPVGTASVPVGHHWPLAPSSGCTRGPVLLRDDPGEPPQPDSRPGSMRDRDPGPSARMLPGDSWRPLARPPMIVDVYHGSHKKSALQPEFLRNARDADLHAGVHPPVGGSEPISITPVAPRPPGRGEGSERSLEVADCHLARSDSPEVDAAVHLRDVLACPQRKVQASIADDGPQVRRGRPAEAFRQAERAELVLDLSLEGPQRVGDGADDGSGELQFTEAEGNGKLEQVAG